MVRLLAIGCVLCCLGAITLWLRPDPWVAAQTKAEFDATRFAAIATTPDRIGMHILQDRSVLRVLIWGPSGAQNYPPTQGMAPSLYEFSEEMAHRLKRIQSAVSGFGWSGLDASETELLFCGETPSICIIYDREQLEAMLQLSPEALQLRMGAMPPIALIMAVLTVLFGAGAIWMHAGDAAMGNTLTIVPEHHLAKRGALEITLTPRDMKLLTLLQERNGAVVTKDELYDAGWGREYMPNSRALDQHIINLRRKLDPHGSLPVVIETVRGVGYRLAR